MPLLHRSTPLSDILLRSDQGLRVESLGAGSPDVGGPGGESGPGAVLRRLGHDADSLFGRAAIGPTQLLAMLRAGLEGFYAFDDLEPLGPSTVRDVRFDVGWRSAMTSRPAGGRMEFVHGEALRRVTHARERRELRHLASRFLARARLGGLLHVVGCGAGLDPAVPGALHDALRDLSAGAPFTLLEVRADPALAGTVEALRPGLLRGHVPRLAPGGAPGAATDAGDLACWTAILGRALALSPCDDWTRRLAGLRIGFADATVRLPFPLVGAPDLGRPIPADLRGGGAVLRNGDARCRPLGEGFRLHAPEPGRLGTELHWTCVWADGPRQLGASLSAAAADSVPLEIVLTVRDGAGRTLARQALTVAPGREEEILLDLPGGADLPLDIRLVAVASRFMLPGERSVADLSALALYPAA